LILQIPYQTSSTSAAVCPHFLALFSAMPAMYPQIGLTHDWSRGRTLETQPQTNKWIYFHESWDKTPNIRGSYSRSSDLIKATSRSTQSVPNCSKKHDYCFDSKKYCLLEYS
jgi:hypothetical protein